jgi:hypothetical protein
MRPSKNRESVVRPNTSQLGVTGPEIEAYPNMPSACR